MKKAVFVISMVLVSLSGWSQMKFGVFIDPQYTWMAPETRNASSDGGTFGFGGGLTFDNYFAKNYAFSSGISIGTQGGSVLYTNAKSLNVDGIGDTSLQANTIMDYSLQYITVPMGLKLRSNQIGYTTLYALIGFTNQFNIRSKASSSDGTLKDDPINKEINFYNMAYHFGGGVEYAFGEDTALNFALIYHNGFLDITKSEPRIGSRVLSLRVGILF